MFFTNASGIGGFDLEMLVDTGSSNSSIRRDILLSAGYTQFIKSDIPSVTATEIIYLDQYPIRTLKINNEIDFILPTVDALDPPKKPVSKKDDALEYESGLLGMDFIGKFADLYIVREFNVMVLTNDTLDATIKILKEQYPFQASNVFQK